MVNKIKFYKMKDYFCKDEYFQEGKIKKYKLLVRLDVRNLK